MEPTPNRYSGLALVLGFLVPALAFGQGAPMPGGEVVGEPPKQEAPPPPPPPVEEAPAQPSKEPVDETAPLAEGMGRLRGVVVDEKTGEPLIEAQVTVVTTGERVLTDLDGNYTIDLAPGTYEVRIFAELKPAKRFGNVVLAAGQTTRLDAALGGDEAAIAVQEVTVVGSSDKTTETVQLVRRQKAATVSDAVSAETIARTPDATAGEAVKRVVAATVQDNRYVLIRGLGGRYSAALLNGVPLPSPDPDVAAVPLDLFPATLLANLTIAKTFSPDIPGNFAGGMLQIETREFPSQFTLRIRGAVSGDTATTFRDTLTYDGGALDFLGYDDGSRKLPKNVPTDKSLERLSRAQADTIGRSWGGPWTPKHSTALPNGGLAVVVGDTVSLAGKPLGYLASFNYGERVSRRNAVVRRTEQDGRTVTETRNVETGIQSAQVGALLNAGWALAPTQRLTFVGFYTHTGDDVAEITRFTPVGDTPPVTNRRMSLRFTERALWFAQLLGEHLVGGPTLNWQLNIANTGQKQPDQRDSIYQASNGTDFTFIAAGSGQGDHFFSNLSDWTYGGGADLNWSFTPARVKLGTLVNITDRTYSARRFRYEPADGADPTSFTQAPETLFASTSVRFREVTTPSDAYRGNRAVVAGYGLVDVVAFDPVRLIAGARYEHSSQSIDTGSDFAIGKSHTERNDGALLPAANLVYALGDHMNLRGAYSYTLARPTFRELSPTVYFDYARGRSSSGNPDLLSTRIHNADLRWELFPGATEVLAASAFFKGFENPIEQVFAGPEGDSITYVNTSRARAWGLEVEGRVDLKRVTPALAPFFAGANLSVIQSRVQLDAGIEGTNRHRALQGQSPYVVNVELGSRFASTGTQASIFYNVFGKRISEVGVDGSPDSYELPFQKLDLTITQRLGEGFTLKATGGNLLSQDVRIKRGSVFIYRYDPGTSFSATLEWAL